MCLGAFDWELITSLSHPRSAIARGADLLMGQDQITTHRRQEHLHSRNQPTCAMRTQGKANTPIWGVRRIIKEVGTLGERSGDDY